MSLSISSPPSHASASSDLKEHRKQRIIWGNANIKLLKECTDSRDAGWLLLFLKYLGGCHLLDPEKQLKLWVCSAWMRDVSTGLVLTWTSEPGCSIGTLSDSQKPIVLSLGQGSVTTVLL